MGKGGRMMKEGEAHRSGLSRTRMEERGTRPRVTSLGRFDKPGGRSKS